MTNIKFPIQSADTTQMTDFQRDMLMDIITANPDRSVDIIHDGLVLLTMAPLNLVLIKE